MLYLSRGNFEFKRCYTINVMSASWRSNRCAFFFFFANCACRLFCFKVIDASKTPPPSAHPCLILFLNTHLHSLLHQPIFSFHLLIMKLSVPLAAVFFFSFFREVICVWKQGGRDKRPYHPNVEHN